MHDYTMNKIGAFVKENYCPEKMCVQDLNELYMWAKIMDRLLEADKNYHVIEAMEEGKNNVKMEWDEFLVRFKKMYKEADEDTRELMKNEIHKIAQSEQYLR